MTPKISVILTTHNRAALLPQAIESVLAQTFRDIELIIVDDGSTDHTQNTLDSFAAKDARLKILRHDAAFGGPKARNTGIINATGSTLALLDDDDIWYPEKLAKQYEVLNSKPENCGLVYCWFEYFSSKTGEILATCKPSLQGNVFRHTIERQPIGNTSTLMVPKGIALDIKGFDETLKRGMDGDFIRRIARTFTVSVVPEVLARLRVQHGHTRITNNRRQGVTNALAGHYHKLKVFPDLAQEYPKETAGLYSAIAGHHVLLDEWAKAWPALSKAVSLAPFSRKPYGVFSKLLLRRLSQIGADRGPDANSP